MCALQARLPAPAVYQRASAQGTMSAGHGRVHADALEICSQPCSHAARDRTNAIRPNHRRRDANAPDEVRCNIENCNNFAHSASAPRAFGKRLNGKQRWLVVQNQKKTVIDNGEKWQGKRYMRRFRVLR